MANDSLSQTAKYLIDVDTKTSEASAKRLFDLMDGLEIIFGKAAGTAKQAAQAFKLEGSDANLIKLQAAVGNLGKAMRDITIAGGNTKLLSDNEVTKVLAIKSEVEKLDKALKQLAVNNSIKEGTLGLDATSIQDKIKALKQLEAAQRANNLAIQEAAKATNDDGAKGKAQYEQRATLIAENIRLIKLQTQALQEQAAQKKGQELNESSGRQYQYKQVLADEKKQLQNQLEQRRQYLKEKSIAEQRQAQEFLSFQPNVALRQAFGDTNPQGASTFQKVNLPGTVPAEQIAAQKQVLDLQNQIVARMREGLPVDQTHLQLIEQVISAKRREAQINAENLNQIREQEGAQRRLSLASGAGAASLLAIQAALRVNGLVLNALQNSLTQALSSAIAVEAEFKNVQAVTATTNTEMETLEVTIKNTAASTKFSSKEVAEAALVLGQAGLSAKETAESIPAVATLATAAGTSLAQAVSLTTSVLGIFDKQASETADIANKITQAANTSKVSVEKLALGFQYAGNIAHLSGISFEETTAALSAMSNAGILNGSTLGSGLRSFLTEVQKPSDEFISTLTRIGLSLDDVDFKAHGLLGVTNTLRQAGFVATDAIKSFDIRGAAAFNALVANPEDLERQYKSLLDTSAAINANEIQMDSLQAQSKRLQTSLENLASAGFAPLGQVLKDAAKGMADLIQGASESNTILQVLGATLGVVAVVSTAKFAVGLAAGALQLAQFEAATVASVRAIGTLTLAQSGAAIYGAIGTAVTSVTVALQGLTAGAFTASGALTALGTAIGGVSLLTGVGVVLAAIAAGYYAVSYQSGEAARAIDKATAEANTAKGAFEAKSKTVNTLDESIKNLTYRQNTLTQGSAELRLAVAEANSKFGDQINVMDLNNTSAKQLITTLQNLRAEQVALRKLDQDNANQAALKLKNITADSARSQVQGLDITSRGAPIRASSALDSVSRGNVDALKALGINPDKLSDAAQAIRSGDLTPENSTALSGLQSSLPKILASTTIIMTDAMRASLNVFATNLPGVAKSVAESRRAAVGFEESSASIVREREVTALKSQKNPAGGTIGEAITTTPALLSKIRQDNPDADSVEIFTLVDEAVKDLNAKNKQLIAYIRKISPKGDTAAAEVVQEVNVQMEELNKQRALALTASDALAKRQNTAAEGTYQQQLRVLKKQPKTPGRDKKIADLESSNEERKFAFQTRGLTDPDQIAEAKDAAQQQAAARLEADQLTRASSRPSSDNKNKEQAAKLAEKSNLASAAADKSLAGLVENFDDVQKLLDEGTVHIQEAGRQAIIALKAKQADELARAKSDGSDIPTLLKEFDSELADQAATNASNLQSYVTGFSAFGKAASKRLADLTRALRDKQLALETDKQNTEQQVFDAGANLRTIQQKQASNKFTGDTNGGSLEQQANRERLNIADLTIGLNSRLIARLGDENTGLIGDQVAIIAELTKKIDPLEKRLKEIIAEALALPEGDPRRTELIAQAQAGSADLKGLQESRTKNTADLKGLRDQKRTAETNDATLGIQREDLRQKIPVEFTFDNVQAGLENAVNQWKDAAANLDIVRTMADGLKGTFNTFTQSLGQNFLAIADGTKTVKGAFRDLAVSVIKSIGEIAAQMAAQAAVKSLFGLALSFIGGASGASSADVSGGAGSVLTPSTEGLGDFSTTAATGGYVNEKGVLERVRHFARGGPVTGGKPGRDSVPALLMPNEFVMNTAAVDAVGTDFLHGLNQQTNSVASSGATSRGKKATDKDNTTVNVWIVSPEQQQPLGPKDVLAIVTDDMVRGGNTKKLIKSIQTGG